MPASRMILLIFLLVSCSGCNDVIRVRRSKALLNEAYKLMKQDTEVTQQWSDHFVRVFTAENRAQFPANRDFLRTHAAQIIKLLDVSSSLNNSAADKYEEAGGLSGNDQQRRGLISFASGFRKSAEANGILKSQMQMISDETIVDEKIFNEKFSQSGHRIQQKRRESEQHIEEGRRLLGW